MARLSSRLLKWRPTARETSSRRIVQPACFDAHVANVHQFAAPGICTWNALARWPYATVMRRLRSTGSATVVTASISATDGGEGGMAQPGGET